MRSLSAKIVLRDVVACAAASIFLSSCEPGAAPDSPDLAPASRASSAAVRSIDLSPTQLRLAVGDSAVLTAVPLGPNGKPTSTPITFTSSAPSVATVSSTGRVAAVGVGSAVITAESGGITATSTVQVLAVAPPPVPDGDGVHEPTGFSSITNRPFNSLAADCADVASAEGWEPSEECAWHHISIIQDPTAPRSPNNVLQAWYPAGTTGGTTDATPGRLVKNFASSQQVYVSIWLKLSTNWIGNGTGTNKVFYIWMNNGPYFFLSAEGSGSGPLVATGRYQGPVDARQAFPPNLGSAAVPRGEWQHWEVLVKANTPGTPNGEFHLWVNGTKASQYTNIGYLAPRMKVSIMAIDVEPIWGGSGSTLAADQFMYIDNVYVSVK